MNPGLGVLGSQGRAVPVPRGVALVVAVYKSMLVGGSDITVEGQVLTSAVLAAAGLRRSQWPMSSSKKSNILTKAKLHTYVEL